MPKKEPTPGSRVILNYQIILSEPQSEDKMESIGIDLGQANVGKVKHTFRDISGNNHTFDFYQIDVWKEIPASFRDVAFYHTFNKTKMLEKDIDLIKAHNLSSIKAKRYLEKYLSDYEKKEHAGLIKKLEVLRGFNE